MHGHIHHRHYSHHARSILAALWCSRHHRGFQGFGFGPGQMFRGDGGRGAGGIGAGRKLGSADLQLLILALLAEKPSHGYELIKAIGERSNGYYSPSPGMIYPALTYLEEIGHADVQTEGSRKRYSITKDGVTFLEANRGTVDTLLEQLAWIGQKMDHVRRAVTGERGDGEAAEDFDAPEGRASHRRARGDHGHGPDHDFTLGIRRARRNLKSALIAKFGASADEQQRIAAILEKAAREIRGEE